MNRKDLLALAAQVLNLPTAPYHEHRVVEFVVDYCRGLGLVVERDKAGNVLVKYRWGKSRSTSKRKSGGMPLVLVAHMDHPGFETLGGRRAEFLGGVPKELFAGAPVRIFTGNGAARAKVGRVIEKEWPRRKVVELEANQTFPKGLPGMWDLPAFRVRNGRLQAAAIDDVLGVVAALSALTDVVRGKVRTHLWAAFTRAEEVGFHGAMELARSHKIPRGTLVVSLEMSRERPWARIGGGPVVRVGDRMMTFDPWGAFFLHEVGKRCAQKNSAFQMQRCLMDGGSCEATVFAAMGYRTSGLCLPLGNYHNRGVDGKVRAEYVSVADLEGLVELTGAAARAWRDFPKMKATLRARVQEIYRRAPRQLNVK